MHVAARFAPRSTKVGRLTPTTEPPDVVVSTESLYRSTKVGRLTPTTAPWQRFRYRRGWSLNEGREVNPDDSFAEQGARAQVGARSTKVGRLTPTTGHGTPKASKSA